MSADREPTAVVECHRKYLEQRCRQRGYTLEEVMPCVLSKNGNIWAIDTLHPAYPGLPKSRYYESSTAAAHTCKAGTELKKLLKKWLNITATLTCSCNARAQVMDANGCDWCAQNVDIIVGWLREEAHKRNLPFIDAAGKILIKRAISNARRAEIEQ